MQRSKRDVELESKIGKGVHIKERQLRNTDFHRMSRSTLVYIAHIKVSPGMSFAFPLR
jgi:hypothetical protein